MKTAHFEKARRFVAEPPRWVEIVIWLLLIFATFGIRAYLVYLVPTVLWSRDAGSYTTSAFQWAHTGIWETDPRRGPVYSLLIALCLKLWGGLNSLMIVQHVLGGIAVMATFVVLRVMHGRGAMWIIGLCGWSFAVYALPLSLEHLIRNETLLFFFASIILASWFLALAKEQPHWLWMTGITAALMQLTKAVFAPFPLVLIALHAFYFRKTPREAVKQIAIFLVAFVIPLAGNLVFHQWTEHTRPPEPQSGILLYGRTAQFTVLDGGIEPEAKEIIRKDVIDYRNLPRLNNNLVLKITIVPKLHSYYLALGKTPADLNKLCRRLAVEGILAHKAEYLKQVMGDLYKLNFKSARPPQAPSTKNLASTAEVLKASPNPDSFIDAKATGQSLEARLDKKHFAYYRHRVMEAWMFYLAPVFLTTILLPLFIWFTRGKHQVWWIGCAAMWYFTLVLLSTVGRPLDRYLLPVVPIIFWTLTSAGIVAAGWIGGRVQDRWVKRSVNSPQSV